MTDLATLLRSLDESGDDLDARFAARVADAFVAAATGVEGPDAELVRAPEPSPPRPSRRLVAVLATAAAVVGIAVGIAVLRGNPADEPLPPASPAPSAAPSVSPPPSPSPSPSPLVRGWGSPVPAPRTVRDWAADVWTGTEWLFWGGYDDCRGCAQAPIATGAAFDPSTGTWRTIPAAPAAALSAGAVWTGTEMLVYGGIDLSSREVPPMAYDPAKGTWRRLPTPPIKRRANVYLSQVVWTGDELFVWGGEPVTDQFAVDPSQPDVGVAYSPATNRWRTLPKAPVTSFRAAYAVVWTGTEVLVWGGVGSAASGAAYDPDANTWRAIATAPFELSAVAAYGWTGRELVVAGGRSGSTVTAASAAYDPAADTWRRLPAPSLTPRLQPAFASGDESFLLWGGQVFEPERRFRDGAVLDARAGTWTGLPALSLSGADVRGARATWTGDRFLLLTTSGTAVPRTYAVVSYVP